MKILTSSVWGGVPGDRRSHLLGMALLAIALTAGVGTQTWAASVCAEVKLQIKQELTLERQGFDAMMQINNGYDMFAISNLSIAVTFQNETGGVVTATDNSSNLTAQFFCRVSSLANINAVTNGNIAAGKTAEIHWLIIPSQGAGGTNSLGMKYSVGATLQYYIRGERESIIVTPDTITVRPMPKLTLDYFLPFWVYGDDPWTPQSEEIIPFTLGLRVKNSGAGSANNLKVESAQPEITENKQGLLVDFALLGCEVQGEPQIKSLLATFGTIASQSAKMARWSMVASLIGRFTNFTASFTHADELGGELTSLIESVNTHTLIRDVLVDYPNRDRILDFLAGNETNTTGIQAYESDQLAPLTVNDFSSVASLSDMGYTGEEHHYRLYVPPTVTPFYVKKDLPSGVDRDVLVTTRSDGKVLDLANVWVSKTRVDGEHPWEYFFNLFDVDGGGNYFVTITNKPLSVNEPPVVLPIAPQVVFEGQLLNFIVEALDPNGTVPTLSAYGVPLGATFTNNESGQGFFSWQTQAGDYGVYPVRFKATDGELEDSAIVRIYVARTNEAMCGNIPCSLVNWSLAIKDVWAHTSSGNATVVWDSIEGMLYEVYYSDYPYRDNANWIKVGETWEGTGAEVYALDTMLDYTDMRRYYKLVLAGELPDTNGVWGVIRRDASAAAFTMMSAPLRTDRRFDGRFGSMLAERLAGADAGIEDRVYIPQADNTWRLLYLDTAKVWREDDGQLSSFVLPAGQGFWVARQTNRSARITFTGPVGNDGSQTNQLLPGWNLVGLSEGKLLDIKPAFTNAMAGAREESADLLTFPNPDGSWRRLMLVANWSPLFNGNWFDLSNFQVYTNKLEPGAAYYYFRQPAAGNTDVPF